MDWDGSWNVGTDCVVVPNGRETDDDPLLGGIPCFSGEKLVDVVDCRDGSGGRENPPED